jgi:tetratricopeptide (TPR) repeat protein
VNERLFGAIERALAAGDIAGAARLAEAALAAGARAPMLFNLAAWAREEAGDLAAAQALLGQGLRLAPDDPLLLTGLGAALRKGHRLEEALAVLDRAVVRLPQGPAGWLERGYALKALGEAARADESFARAAAADPACAPAHAARAELAARGGDRAAVQAHAALALRHDAGSATAQLALAESDTEAGGAGEAADRLHRLLARPDLATLDRVRALGLLGDALDRLDRVDPAFAAYAEAKRLYRAVHASFAQPPHRLWVEALTRRLRASMPAAWAPLPPPPDDFAPHIFLLGYPRSGTTLIENVLAGVPAVRASEEKPLLAAADAAFLLKEDGFDRLRALDAAAAAPFRTAYAAAAIRAGGVAGGPFVDMDPLKSLRLPVIARLFPAAQVVLMRRDPRDVVWSCFRQNFRPSAANLAHADLVEGARHYDAVMRFVEEARACLPLSLLEVDYRALVTDFDATTRAVCRFAGLPWSEALRRFDRTAVRRGVTTASATQLRHGLFDGSGRWRRYADHIGPALPILRPWVERFGFD